MGLGFAWYGVEVLAFRALGFRTSWAIGETDARRFPIGSIVVPCCG